MGSFFKSLGSGILRIFGATASGTEEVLKQSVTSAKDIAKEAIIKEISGNIQALVVYMQDALNTFKKSQKSNKDIETLLMVLKIIIMARGK